MNLNDGAITRSLQDVVTLGFRYGDQPQQPPPIDDSPSASTIAEPINALNTMESKRKMDPTESFLGIFGDTESPSPTTHYNSTFLRSILAFIICAIVSLWVIYSLKCGFYPVYGKCRRLAPAGRGFSISSQLAPTLQCIPGPAHDGVGSGGN